MSACRIGIARYVRKTLIDQFKPCFLFLDGEFRLLRLEGDADYYGYEGLRLGEDCRDALPYLFGLEAGGAIHLPLIETASGRAADLLLAPMQGGQGLLLIDAGRERAARQVVQQQANEIRLLYKEQQKLVEELRAARDELAEKHRAAQETSRVKTRFIAGLSHDLRTPLSGILGQTDLLRDRKRSRGAVAESLMLVEANANHLLSLVDNVLDQASLEIGQLALHPIPTRLADLCREMKTMFTPQALRNGLKFKVRRNGALPEWIKIDGTRLRQVVINLVGNGIKYTDVGFVTLVFGWTNDRLQVRVSDSGPGISPVARQRIFLAFHREKDTIEKQGAGLGLAISTQLVALMGGELRLEDRPSGGSVFSFEVPAPSIGDAGRGADTNGAGRLVLLVDDSSDIRVLYERVLTKAGFRVQTAADEPEAWRLYEQERPVLLVVDLYLKEWDGSGLVRRLRARGYSGGILTWSASSLREDRQRAMGAGADIYLVKPVEGLALCATVSDVLRRRESA